MCLFKKPALFARTPDNKSPREEENELRTVLRMLYESVFFARLHFAHTKRAVTTSRENRKRENHIG